MTGPAAPVAKPVATGRGEPPARPANTSSSAAKSRDALTVSPPLALPSPLAPALTPEPPAQPAIPTLPTDQPGKRAGDAAAAPQSPAEARIQAVRAVDIPPSGGRVATPASDQGAVNVPALPPPSVPVAAECSGHGGSDDGVGADGWRVRTACSGHSRRMVGHLLGVGALIGRRVAGDEGEAVHRADPAGKAGRDDGGIQTA